MSDLKASIKLPLFDGKDENFPNWWARFKEFGCVHGFSDVLTETKPKELELSENDVKHTDEKNHPEAVTMFKKNAVAVAQLTMCFTNENAECMAFVYKSMTQEWPNGCVWIIIQRLFKKYRPSDLMVEVELNAKLQNLKLKDNESPTVLFTQIAGIENWYLHDLGEARVLPALTNALPKEYRHIVADYGLLAASARDMDVLETRLVSLWRSFGGGQPKDNGSEIVMAGVIECYLCKAVGHKANHCPQKGKNGGNGGGKNT